MPMDSMGIPFEATNESNWYLTEALQTEVESMAPKAHCATTENDAPPSRNCQSRSETKSEVHRYAREADVSNSANQSRWKAYESPKPLHHQKTFDAQSHRKRIVPNISPFMQSLCFHFFPTGPHGGKNRMSHTIRYVIPPAPEGKKLIM